MDGCIARMHAWVGLGGLAVGGWRDGGTDARMNGWKDGWTDGCTDVQMQMCVYIYIRRFIIHIMAVAFIAISTLRCSLFCSDSRMYNIYIHTNL